MAGKHKDLTGNVFSRLTALEYQGAGKWRCSCVCGNEKVTTSWRLKDGSASSCGCFKNELSSLRFTKHGMSSSAEYKTWVCMIRRCNRVKDVGYKWYGGRGIRVCDAWTNSFKTFFKDMGERPSSKHSIDRINSNGNYEPGNCRWATWIEQQNNVSSNVFLFIKGEKLTASQASRKYNISKSTLKFRMKNNLSHDDYVFKPIQKRNKIK